MLRVLPALLRLSSEAERAKFPPKFTETGGEILTGVLVGCSGVSLRAACASRAKTVIWRHPGLQAGPGHREWGLLLAPTPDPAVQPETPRRALCPVNFQDVLSFGEEWAGTQQYSWSAGMGQLICREIANSAEVVSPPLAGTSEQHPRGKTCPTSLSRCFLSLGLLTSQMRGQKDGRRGISDL